MKNIYSKIDPSIIIFTVIKKEEIKAGRINLTPDSEYLQVGVKKVFNGEFFKPHKLWRKYITGHHGPVSPPIGSGCPI